MSYVFGTQLPMKTLFDDLPRLSEYTLQRLWYEWTVEVIVGGKSYPPLRELERRRTYEGYAYRASNNRKCKMQVYRRRRICEYVESKVLNGLTLKDAFAEINSEMKSQSGDKWSLNKLVVYISTNTKSRK